MHNFRESLLTLPFVGRTSEGTLDYWSVATTGHRETDLNIGRSHAARALHFAREFDAAFIAAHIFEAWCADMPVEQGYIREGYGLEATDACFAAPQDATTNLQIAARMLTGDLQADLHRLPFVRSAAAGGLDFWVVTPTGDWTEDTATGRFYGALTCQFMRNARSGEIFGHIVESMLAGCRFEETRAIWTGWIIEIAEVEMASPPGATLAQESAWPYHRESLSA